MPSASPAISETDREHLARLGERIRQARKQQRVSAVSAAQAAGMSRPTLHRIERGEPSVTIAAWACAASALGLSLALVDSKAPPVMIDLPERIRLADYSQLNKLAWQLQGVEDLAPREALEIYERNWRHVDRQSLSTKEIALIRALSTTLGGGRLLV